MPGWSTFRMNEFHKLLEETDDWLLFKVGIEGYVPFGNKYVFKRDVNKGDIRGKAGTTRMIYADVKPRKIELRKKYLVK